MGVENVLLTRNQSITNYDRSNVFLRDNLFEAGSFENDTYDDITLEIGTLMGRNATTSKLQVLASGSSDGSQYPVGVLAETLTILAGDEANIQVCVGGEVAKDKLILDGSDALTTVIDGRQIQDRIAGDTLGIKLVTVDELSGFDNQ
jgi:hypothetical protein